MNYARLYPGKDAFQGLTTVQRTPVEERKAEGEMRGIPGMQ